jgi:phosphinothricin acetyltransferase
MSLNYNPTLHSNRSTGIGRGRTPSPQTVVRVGPLTAADWPAVRAIYEEGIATHNATFETAAPDWATWDVARLPVCRLAARRGGQVVGWAALSPVSSRAVYCGVAEVSVYVAEGARGQGVGRLLLTALVEAAEAAGIWTLQAGIFPENAASVALHRSCGFRIVGRRERLGCHYGVWRDSLLMERRSSTVGVACE